MLIASLVLAASLPQVEMKPYPAPADVILIDNRGECNGSRNERLSADMRENAAIMKRYRIKKLYGKYPKIYVLESWGYKELGAFDWTPYYGYPSPWLDYPVRYCM